jgi:hypothetical protein
MSEPTLAERIASTNAQLAAGDPVAAFQELRVCLEYPQAALAERADFVQAFRTFAAVGRAIAGAELGSVLDRVAGEPDSAQALYDAGYALIEQSLPRIAATVLLRANVLAPGHPPILSELSVALEDALAYGEAINVLEASEMVGRDPLLTYLAGFHSLMTGAVAKAGELLGTLQSISDAEIAPMAELLRGMVLRSQMLADAGVELGEHGLTGWHAALNGSLLLSESPHGYEEPMRGRYAWLQDGPGLMLMGIRRLGQVLEQVAMPVRVIAAPDRASQILAHAVARAFALPLVPWKQGVEPGLVVAWNLSQITDTAFLAMYREHRAGDILFAHASEWIDPFPYAPDVTTLLVQSITNHYTGGALRHDPSTGEMGRTQPDERAAEAIADEIIAGTPSESQTPETLPLEVARALASAPLAHRLGLTKDQGPRLRQRAGSPVASARFG